MATPVRTDEPACLTIRVATAGRHRCLVVHGGLDAISAPLLDEQVREALSSADVIGLELDLGQVSFLGAAGVRSVALAQQLARRSNRAFHVSCGSRRAVLRPLQLTGLLTSVTTGDRPA